MWRRLTSRPLTSISHIIACQCRETTKHAYRLMTSETRPCFKASCPNSLVLHVPRRCISKKHYNFPELLESDLEEMFVRGSGPGGQAVNKTANNVILKHLPTGTVVKCHETRILDLNRKIAREKMILKLDVLYNGKDSFAEQQKLENSQNRQTLKQKNKKRLEMKMAFKNREGLE